MSSAMIFIKRTQLRLINIIEFPKRRDFIKKVAIKFVYLKNYYYLCIVEIK